MNEIYFKTLKEEIKENEGILYSWAKDLIC